MSSAAAARGDSALERARILIERAPGQAKLETLGQRVGLSPGHLRRSFVKAFGLSPSQYARAVRLARAREQLGQGSAVTDALYAAGFGSSRAFYEIAPRVLGMLPSQLRGGGRGLEIRHTLVTSPLGLVLVAATEVGVCSVKIGDAPERLVAQLADEFPQARLVRDDRGLAEVAALIGELAAGREAQRGLPVDVRGTVFQWRVWRAIGGIPRGRTKTYGQLALELGRPGGARAVASACARNRVALVIPCHRVVPQAGGEGGYRWGAERKRRLLEAETRAG
ncbi:MAG: bifunctional transcriptional activator/DNA repair enzyme AdaA [Candidatus Dormibacteria bacterium]